MELGATYSDLPELDDAAYGRIADLVYRHTGIRLGPGKRYFVLGRLGGLLRRLGCGAWDELPGRFEAASPSLVDELIRAAITPETSFFRDEVPFRALAAEVVPALLSGARRPLPLRVWSAGCSTGQEPYSVVMALWDRVTRGEVDLSVWATDLCQVSLEAARRGVYGPLQLGRGLGDDVRCEFFQDLPGCGAAQVRPEVRARVRFDRVNLVQSPPVEGFHVVLCRNVAIYFDRPAKERLFRTLAAALLPGGTLILGAAETLHPPLLGFEARYFERALLYRKTHGSSEG